MKTRDQFLLEEAYFKIWEAYWAGGGSSVGVTGWLTKLGKWIPVETYHDDPQYIDQLEPDLKDPKLKVNRKKEYSPDDYPGQEEKKDECIKRGAIRVAQADMGGGAEITIQANSLYALKGAVSKLSKMFPNQMERMPITGDVCLPNGDVRSLELIDGKWQKLVW